MAFVAIPDGIRVVHKGLVHGQELVMTFGAQNGANGFGGDSLENIATNHGQAFRTHVLPRLSGTFTHTETLAYALEDQTMAPGVARLTGQATGGTGGTVHPLSLCMVVTHITAKRGRNFTGRTFLGPLPGTAFIEQGRSWATDAVAAMQTAVNAYKGAVDPATDGAGRLAVCTRGSATRGVPAGTEPVTALKVRALIGTQRRRLQ